MGIFKDYNGNIGDMVNEAREHGVSEKAIVEKCIEFEEEAKEELYERTINSN